jgi:hypothetical protein
VVLLGDSAEAEEEVGRQDSNSVSAVVVAEDTGWDVGSVAVAGH